MKRKLFRWGTGSLVVILWFFLWSPQETTDVVVGIRDTASSLLDMTVRELLLGALGILTMGVLVVASWALFGGAMYGLEGLAKMPKKLRRWYRSRQNR